MFHIIVSKLSCHSDIAHAVEVSRGFDLCHFSLRSKFITVYVFVTASAPVFAQ